ncbi:hypothetical protein HDU81_004955 [Chytriomyces hyalinus]|nr:hypothetical protein HDU81_004955 [Chytriomyces hyalinus]
METHIHQLESAERDIKEAISKLSNYGGNCDDSLSLCERIEETLAQLLSSIDVEIEREERERRDRRNAVEKRLASVSALQNVFIAAGYEPGEDDQQLPAAVPSTVPSTPPPKQPNRQLNNAYIPDVFVATPGTAIGASTLGGLVGANEFEFESEPEESPLDAYEESSDDDEFDAPPVGFNAAAAEDPPSPTLESLGISSLGLGLLKGIPSIVILTVINEASVSFKSKPGVLVSDPKSPDHATPSTQRIARLRLSSTSLNSAKSSSPGAPEITETPHHHKMMTDNINSIFGDLIRSVRMEEYMGLPEFIRPQLSFNLLNEIISEINEFITDRRFHGMDEDARIMETDSITLEELSHVSSIDPSKVKPAMVALLHMGRMISKEDGAGGKRYLLA